MISKIPFFLIDKLIQFPFFEKLYLSYIHRTPKWLRDWLGVPDVIATGNSEKTKSNELVLSEIRMFVYHKGGRLRGFVARTTHSKDESYLNSEYAKLIQSFINDVKRLNSQSG